MFTRVRISQLTAEFVGTAVLTSTAIVITQTTQVSYFVATTVGLTLAVLVLFFGSISGCHVNPAITFGLWTARRIGTLKAVSYVAVQLLGALIAWQLYHYLSGQPLQVKHSSFTTQIWLAEAVGTFILAIGVASAVSRKLSPLESAVAIGPALFVGIMIASSASLGILNPAVALGLRAWDVAYVLGPLVGGLIGVNLYVNLMVPRMAATSRRKAKA